MANTLSDWTKVLSNCELPVLHQSKLKLQTLQENEQDITISVLTDIARQDPGFSIHLLRHAGLSSNKEITTLSHAISLISIPLVIKMLNDLPTLEQTLDKEHIAKILDIYAFQNQVAYIAKQWSILRRESENNELFTAGLNRGFFSFMLYLIDIELAKKIEKIYFSTKKDYESEERKLLGNSVDEISEKVAKHWKLPELICESFSGKHHNPKISGVRLATDLLHQIYTCSSFYFTAEMTNSIAKYMRVPVEKAHGKINQILINTIRTSWEYLPYQPLLLMIMSYPSLIKKKEQKKTITHPDANIKNTVVADSISLLRNKNSNYTPRELIEIALKAMKNGIGFARVAFMPFDKIEKCLNVRFQSVDKNTPKLSPLKISIKLNKLFNQLLKKEQVLSIHKNNQHKFSHLLPPKLRPLNSDAAIIINSFYANNKIVGCFFVDHGNTDEQLSANDIKLFKLICTELKTAIESTLVKKNSVKKAA